SRRFAPHVGQPRRRSHGLTASPLSSGVAGGMMGRSPRHRHCGRSVRSQMAVATIPFIQARNYTRGRSNPIDVLVIHTMESPEKPDTAESVAHWFAGSTAPQASAHYCIDNNSTVQCVRDTDVAWHAPGANHNGLGFEHAGRAAQTPAEWKDPYSTQLLEVSAQIVAEKCKEYGIPAVW